MERTSIMHLSFVPISIKMERNTVDYSLYYVVSTTSDDRGRALNVSRRPGDFNYLPERITTRTWNKRAREE